MWKTNWGRVVASLGHWGDACVSEQWLWKQLDNWTARRQDGSCFFLHGWIHARSSFPPVLRNQKNQESQILRSTRQRNTFSSKCWPATVHLYKAFTSWLELMFEEKIAIVRMRFALWRDKNHQGPTDMIPFVPSPWQYSHWQEVTGASFSGTQKQCMSEHVTLRSAQSIFD